MKDISVDKLVRQTRRILDSHFWIPVLQTNEQYCRIQDDHDGTREGQITISFSFDGDAWVCTDKHLPSMRFRMIGGGGQSPRVRNALMVLAYAIALDNNDHPQE